MEFDYSDAKNVGRPRYLNLDHYYSVIQGFLSCDETETALYMLNHMPGWYRDNVPDKAKELRQKIYQKLATPISYSRLLGCEHLEESKKIIAMDHDGIAQNIHLLSRCSIAHNIVKHVIEQGQSVHIHEEAPGSYWLPISLKKMGMTFTYCGYSLNKLQEDLAKDFLKEEWSDLPKDKNIFVCYELIEHLHNPEEIVHAYHKASLSFDCILLSTPLYCYNGGNIDVLSHPDIGHLRTYTPREFFEFANKHWPNFKWSSYQDDVITLIGERQG